MTPEELQAAAQRAFGFGQAGVAISQAKALAVPSVPAITFSESKLEGKAAPSTTIPLPSQGDSGNNTNPLTNDTIWIGVADGGPPVATEFGIYLEAL